MSASVVKSKYAQLPEEPSYINMDVRAARSMNPMAPVTLVTIVNFADAIKIRRPSTLQAKIKPRTRLVVLPRRRRERLRAGSGERLVILLRATAAADPAHDDSLQLQRHAACHWRQEFER